jgi:hypothetical protein
MIGFPHCTRVRPDALAPVVERLFKPQRQRHQFAGGNFDVPFDVRDAGPVEGALDTAKQGVAEICCLLDRSQSRVQGFRSWRPRRGPEFDQMRRGVHHKTRES